MEGTKLRLWALGGPFKRDTAMDDSLRHSTSISLCMGARENLVTLTKPARLRRISPPTSFNPKHKRTPQLVECEVLIGKKYRGRMDRAKISVEKLWKLSHLSVVVPLDYHTLAMWSMLANNRRIHAEQTSVGSERRNTLEYALAL